MVVCTELGLFEPVSVILTHVIIIANIRKVTRYYGLLIALALSQTQKTGSFKLCMTAAADDLGLFIDCTQTLYDWSSKQIKHFFFSNSTLFLNDCSYRLKLVQGIFLLMWFMKGIFITHVSPTVLTNWNLSRKKFVVLVHERDIYNSGQPTSTYNWNLSREKFAVVVHEREIYNSGQPNCTYKLKLVQGKCCHCGS